MENDLKKHMASVSQKNAAAVADYFKKRPHATRESCAFYLGLSLSTVNRHVKKNGEKSAKSTD